MKALLIQYDLANALKPADQWPSSSTTDQAKKTEILEKAHHAIYSVGDKPLIEVSKEKPIIDL